MDRKHDSWGKKALKKKSWKTTIFRRTGPYILLTGEAQEGRTKVECDVAHCDPRTAHAHHVLTSSKACTDGPRHTWCMLGGLSAEEICFPAVSRGVCKQGSLTCPFCAWWSQATLQPWLPQEESCLKLTHGVLEGILWDSQYIHKINLCQKGTLQH